MAEFLLSAFEDSLEGIKTNSIEKIRYSREGSVKHLNYIAESVDNNIIVALALYSPEASELRSLIAMLKSTNELMRIADSLRKYSKSMQEILESDFDFEGIKQYVLDLHIISVRSIRHVIECFKDFNMDSYRSIHIEEEKSDEIFGIFQKELLANPPAEQDKMLMYLKVIKTLKKHERVTDHCENIARLVYYANEGGRLTTKL